MYACPKLVGSFPAAPKLTQFNLNNSLYTQELYPSGEWCLVVSEGSLLKGIKRASGVFSSITKVEFRGCGSLKSCQLDFLPHFSKFIIRDCLELESLRIREGPLLSLHQLVVIGCPNLKSLPENMHSLLPSLEKLVLGLLPQVDSFPEETLLLPSTITSLEFNCLRNLKSLDYKELQQLTSLRNLKICQCPKLEFIPEKSLPSSIEHLEIMDLKDLDYKGLQHLTSLRQLKIWSCSKLENIPEESLPSSLEHLEIWNMKDLNYKGLQHLTSLRRLKICGCPKLVSLPEEGLPSSLRYLEIRNLENLESLNYKGLQHLNSLRRLHIWMCPKLKSMPEEGLPSSLEYLKIIRCPSLAKSCERKTGKDWPKISHIPGVTIKMLSKA
ncbi:unnamed protein product [Dovyalis caffra]|uniref:Uncharacterized protein n=1 Tax=Dovyalis caffra TaxID=77055 RepID=A0AAV1QPM7_9ROSI|nr:unnamed protein product [Dovyalis caffra]